MALAASKLGRFILQEGDFMEGVSDDHLLRRLRDAELLRPDAADEDVKAAFRTAREEHAEWGYSPYNSPHERVKVFLRRYLSEKGCQWAKPFMCLDLPGEPDQDEIEDFIREGVNAFLEANPGVEPTCVALYCSPANGWVSLCIDTEDRGFPKTNCHEFSHAGFRLLERPAWPAEYAAKKLAPSNGEDTCNESFFLSLNRISSSYYGNRDAYRPKWAGVQILDSRLCSFWGVGQRQKNRYALPNSTGPRPPRA